MAKLCSFGKEIKKRLVDIDKNQNWLIGQVQKDTGRYFDCGYLYKVLVGEAAPADIVASIRRILELGAPKG